MSRKYEMRDDLVDWLNDAAENDPVTNTLKELKEEDDIWEGKYHTIWYEQPDPMPPKQIKSRKAYDSNEVRWIGIYDTYRTATGWKAVCCEDGETYENTTYYKVLRVIQDHVYRGHRPEQPMTSTAWDPNAECPF